MNATKKLICILTAGTTLVLAAPVFAGPGRDRGHDFNRDHRHYSNYDRNTYRYYNRGYDRRRFVVARRPIFVAPPVYYTRPAPIAYDYYAQPAPIAYGIGPATVIGAVIGGIIDNRY